MSTAPSPRTITAKQLRQYTELYPAVVERAYAQRTKGNKAKQAEAVERDAWRYETLPREIACEGEGEGKGELTLEQLQRLVQWKM